ncbi:50S ribosome-binding GTPase [Burkholderia multivorans]|uniref:GTPase n=1 Tax=Burkholderia multivorans TaxID=87883 RepID=UPI001C24865D|nr:50S ribosome-binding GTPase [Burkholderia multivorans]
MVGRSAIGKSSTINSLLGEEVAPVGKYRPQTTDAETYSNFHDEVAFHGVDTPGLRDELEEEGNKRCYLERIHKAERKIDCVWFVTKLVNPTVSGDEKRGIKLLKEAFGQEVWMLRRVSGNKNAATTLESSLIRSKHRGFRKLSYSTSMKDQFTVATSAKRLTKFWDRQRAR